MRYGVYLVTGKRRYRGHEPGTTFEAALERGAEWRAIDRGDIRLIRRVTPRVPDEHGFPDGWLSAENQPANQAPDGAFSMPERG
jgi:hypothetical protein